MWVEHWILSAVCCCTAAVYWSNGGGMKAKNTVSIKISGDASISHSFIRTLLGSQNMGRICLAFDLASGRMNEPDLQTIGGCRCPSSQCATSRDLILAPAVHCICGFNLSWSQSPSAPSVSTDFTATAALTCHPPLLFTPTEFPCHWRSPPFICLSPPPLALIM